MPEHLVRQTLDVKHSKERNNLNIIIGIKEMGFNPSTEEHGH
jgi:hypothetical protein